MKMDQFNITISEGIIPNRFDGGEQCSYVFLHGNRFTTETQMMLMVSDVTKYRMYNEFAKLDRNDNSERIVIFGLNGLLNNSHPNFRKVDFFKQNLDKKKYNYTEFAIFAIFSFNEFNNMNKAIKEYINNRDYVEFEDYHRDNPWLRLIAIK